VLLKTQPEQHGQRDHENRITQKGRHETDLRGEPSVGITGQEKERQVPYRVIAADDQGCGDRAVVSLIRGRANPRQPTSSPTPAKTI
jgi:hypothetical protein